MNQTTEHILWPYDKKEVFVCSCCGCELSELESADPCEIKGEVFCDSCSDSLTQLRLNGFISEVSSKTAELKEAHDWACYNAVLETYKFKTVRHI